MKRVLVLGLVVLLVIGSAVAASSQTPEWIVYNTDNSELPHDQVIALAFDAQGNLWIGTNHGGLVRFNEETWMVYNEVNSGLPDNWIWILLIDTQGNTWIGTYFGGLVVYREGGVILTGVQE